jgi:hypothetical protein
VIAYVILNSQETKTVDNTNSNKKMGIEFDGKVIYFAGNALINEGKHYLTLRIDSNGIDKMKLDVLTKFLEVNREEITIKLEHKERKNKHE